MALILDKTASGITSIIIVSGITENFVETGYTETKPTKTGWIETAYDGNTFVKTTYATGYTYINYTDNFGGVNTNPYLIIKSIDIDRIFNRVKIIIFIYKDAQARIDNRNPLDGRDYLVNDKDTFDRYFSMSVLESSSIFKKAYEYLNTIIAGWKSDE